MLQYHVDSRLCNVAWMERFRHPFTYFMQRLCTTSITSPTQLTSPGFTTLVACPLGVLVSGQHAGVKRGGVRLRLAIADQQSQRASGCATPILTPIQALSKIWLYYPTYRRPISYSAVALGLWRFSLVYFLRTSTYKAKSLRLERYQDVLGAQANIYTII